MAYTILAWNSRRILVNIIEAPSLYSDQYWEALEKMRRALRHKKDDPRWQAWPGTSVIEASTRCKIATDLKPGRTHWSR